ncbi:MAG TPA: hypothetical protein EYN59_02910 [Candidatus Marinimicrobia bacterium]|nr:hypothetical protein [Candidatus Neomarinimicrobiota bacterium]
MIVTASQCLNKLNSNTDDIQREFADIYGEQLTVNNERLNAITKLVEHFIKIYNEKKKIIISRAPARVNLMGRHIDHQGGYVNTIAIDKEILLAASPRNDNIINIKNVNSTQFPTRELKPNTLLDIATFSDWETFVRSSQVQNLNKSIPDDWSMYILAAFYRLQLHFPDVRLKGIDCIFSGNIPVGSGLSSSSALGVAFSQGLLTLNNIHISKNLLIEMIGESELFVGFQGGKADPSAIITAAKGMVSTIGFFPLHISSNTPMPENLKVIIGYSGTAAKKVGSIKDIFNQRVACYRLAMMILRQQWGVAKNVHHLRDLLPQRLNISVKNVFKAVSSLPVYPTREKITHILGDDQKELLIDIFMTHKDPGTYDLIGVTLFGLSECARSESFHKGLLKGDLNEIKNIIDTSHNGDRLFSFNNRGDCVDFDHSVTVGHLAEMEENETPLTSIPGNYGCSTKGIDQMVDIANRVPGTVGAQLAGAGMGGNITILAKDNYVEHVLHELRDQYYQPQNIPFDAHICYPISGASVLRTLR